MSDQGAAIMKLHAQMLAHRMWIAQVTRLTYGALGISPETAKTMHADLVANAAQSTFPGADPLISDHTVDEYTEEIRGLARLVDQLMRSEQT